MKTKLYMCAGESTELGTMPTEDNQRTCFSVARAGLSEGMGVLLDYTRIKPSRKQHVMGR